MLKPLSQFLLVTSAFVIGCSGGGGSGSENPVTVGGDGVVDFNQPINTRGCIKSYDNVFNNADYYETEFHQELTMGGDPSCLKKVIEKGGLNVNERVAGTFGRDPDLPVWLVLRKRSLFFNNSKGAEFKMLKVLVDAGADLNIINNAGDNPLLHSLKIDDAEKYRTIPQYIITTKKVDLNQKDRNGLAPIHHVIQQKDKKLFASLQQHGANLEEGAPSRAPIFTALTSHWEEGVQLLVAAGVSTTVKNSSGRIPLQIALGKNYEQASQDLYVKLPNSFINHQDSSGVSLLVSALQSGTAGIDEQLLNRGADVNLISDFDDTALRASANRSSIDLFKRVLGKTSREVMDHKPASGAPLLIDIVENKSVEMAKLLLQAGASVAVTNSFQETAAHVAARRGDSNMMSAILPYNPNLSARNNKGNTPLHVASLANTKVLVTSGAPLEITNDKGRTPLVEAFRKSQDIVQFLLNAGSKTNYTSGSGNLLHMAASSGYTAIMAQLAESVDVNATDSDGRTPFFNAKSPSAIKKLATLPGINFEARSNSGETAFTTAVKNYLWRPHDSLLDGVRALVEVGVNVNAPGGDGLPISFRVVKADNNLHVIMPGKGVYHGALWPILLQSKLDLDARDKEGKTILFYVDTVEEIRELRKGTQVGPIDEGIKDNSGATALQYFEFSLDARAVQLKQSTEKLMKLRDDLASATNAGEQAKVEEIEAAIVREEAFNEQYKVFVQHLTEIVTELSQ